MLLACFFRRTNNTDAINSNTNRYNKKELVRLYPGGGKSERKRLGSCENTVHIIPQNLFITQHVNSTPIL